MSTCQETVLIALYTLSHLILGTNLWGRIILLCAFYRLGNWFFYQGKGSYLSYSEEYSLFKGSLVSLLSKLKLCYTLEWTYATWAFFPCFYLGFK